MLFKARKYDGGRGTSSLIAVKEGVILHDMEEVSCCHLEEVMVKILATVRSLRHGDGGVEQTHIANPFRAAVAFDQTAMQSQGLIQIQKQRRRHGLLRQLLHRIVEPLMNHRHGAVELLLFLGISHGREN